MKKEEGERERERKRVSEEEGGYMCVTVCTFPCVYQQTSMTSVDDNNWKFLEAEPYSTCIIVADDNDGGRLKQPVKKTETITNSTNNTHT